MRLPHHVVTFQATDKHTASFSEPSECKRHPDAPAAVALCTVNDLDALKHEQSHMMPLMMKAKALNTPTTHTSQIALPATSRTRFVDTKATTPIVLRRSLTWLAELEVSECLLEASMKGDV